MNKNKRNGSSINNTNVGQKTYTGRNQSDNVYRDKKCFRLWPIEFGQTGISAIRSADPENPTVEPNMK